MSSREPWFPALTFAEVSKQNRARACRWHPGFPAHDSWNGADWSNALNGEAGEAANIVKKLRRHETGHHGALDGDESQLLADLGDELADVFLYLDLLAAKYGIDLTAHIVEKFNVVSERQGFPERLGSANSHSETSPFGLPWVGAAADPDPCQAGDGFEVVFAVRVERGVGGRQGCEGRGGVRHGDTPGITLELFANPPDAGDPDLLNVFVDAEAWRAAHPCSCHSFCVCDVAVET